MRDISTAKLNALPYICKPDGSPKRRTEEIPFFNGKYLSEVIIRFGFVL